MDSLINILTNFLLYISVPVAIRYAILRRPIRSKWIAAIILLPIFIVFATLIGNQREVAQKQMYEQAGILYRSTPHMIGSPILYGAIALGFVVLRRGCTKEQPKHNEQVISAEGYMNNSDYINDDLHKTAYAEKSSGQVEPATWVKAFAVCLGVGLLIYQLNTPSIKTQSPSSQLAIISKLSVKFDIMEKLVNGAYIIHLYAEVENNSDKYIQYVISDCTGYDINKNITFSEEKIPFTSNDFFALAPKNNGFFWNSPAYKKYPSSTYSIVCHISNIGS